MKNRMIRMKDVPQRMGKKRSSTLEDVKNGLLPRPIKCGSRATGIQEYELEAVMVARAAGQPDSVIRQLVQELEAKRQLAWQELRHSLVTAGEKGADNE